MKFLSYLASFLLLICLYGESSQADTLYFMGLKGEDWQLFKAQHDLKQTTLNPQHIPGFENIRDFSVNTNQSAIAFIDASGSIMLHSFETKKTKALDIGDSDDRFTQLSFSSPSELWAVHLPAGNSRQTYLVKIDIRNGELSRAVSRRGAQFDPIYNAPYLYFTTALCIDDCDPMIWELWRRDMRSARMEQLTLTGAVARTPLPSKNELYFISNKAGYYHIWRKSLDSEGGTEQLTEGQVTDSDLQIDREGGLFFIRKTPAHTGIYRLTPEKKTVSLDMPKDISDMRGLEVVRP